MDLLQRLHLDWCRAVAEARGGACLSARYVDRDTKLAWRCALGHRWTAAPRPILEKGNWCATCGHARRSRRDRDNTMASVQSIALERGGRCVSRSYDGHQARLEFECAVGHRWRTLPTLVIRGHWCRRCSLVEANRGLKQQKFASLQAIARRHGGECLSTSYPNVWAKLRWRCAQGHVWEAAGKQVGDGAWCARCAGVAKHTLQECRGFAAGRGGECLSDEYVDAVKPLSWKCAAGHRWRASLSNVMHQDNWCPRCHGTPRDELARLQRIARRHRGECLSQEYGGSGAHHLWRCREGHEWWTRARNVVSGSWCTICRRTYGPRPVLTLEDMVEVAAERGGQCLSKHYVNTRLHLRWRCARGHEWEASASGVRGRGHWCPQCSTSVRGTLDGLRAWAMELGGRCLSTVHDDARKPLRWECAKGHRFEALAKAVKSGVWCSKCAKRPTDPRPRRYRRRPRAKAVETT